VPPGGDAGYDWLPRAGTAVDQVTLAGGLATEVMEGLMERERMNRVSLFFARDRQQMNLHELMETILRRTWLAEDAQGPSASSLQRVVRRVVLNTMLDRAGDARTTADVRQVVALTSWSRWSPPATWPTMHSVPPQSAKLKPSSMARTCRPTVPATR
jgi:hypothetical protein